LSVFSYKIGSLFFSLVLLLGLIRRSVSWSLGLWIALLDLLNMSPVILHGLDLVASFLSPLVFKDGVSSFILHKLFSFLVLQLVVYILLNLPQSLLLPFNFLELLMLFLLSS